MIMSKILFMSVGTGLGKTNPKESLAQGLAFSINETEPDHIVFIVTEKSKETVTLIEKCYEEEYNNKIDYETVHINSPDNFNECFEKISDKIKEYSDEKVYIDYTSGTKTMSLTVAIISVLYHNKLTSVTGKRGDNGTVIHGTEELIQHNPYSVYDKLNIEKVKHLFNYNRFETAAEILDTIVVLEDKEKIKTLVNYYDKWDKFHHENFPNDMNSELFTDLEAQLKQNQKSMSIILKKGHDQKCYYLLADLINNSQRRYEEGKYDDAIARLYRSLELVAQIRLKKEYDIITSDVDMKILGKHIELSKKYLERLKGKGNNNKKIKIGLSEDYILLNNLNDPIGQYYKQNEEEYKNILSKRNKSILAHGTEPKTKEDYEKFKELVLNIARELDSRMDDFIEETKFPKFKVD